MSQPTAPLDPNDVSSFSGESEFGLPVGYIDPTDYRGTTPPCDACIDVRRNA